MHPIQRIEFEWPVCTDGYRIDKLRDVPRHEHRVQAKSDKVIKKRHLEAFPGMFLRFAEINSERQKLLSFANAYGLLYGPKSLVEFADNKLKHWYGMSNWMRSVYGIKTLHRSRQITYSMVNPQLSGCFQADEKTGSAIFVIRPQNLIDAMLIQLGLWLNGDGGDFKKCNRAGCADWFAYGKGTRRRSTSEYCSDRCREAERYHRRRAEGKL